MYNFQNSSKKINFDNTKMIYDKTVRIELLVSLYLFDKEISNAQILKTTKPRISPTPKFSFEDRINHTERRKCG